jgi:hypothetical protein
VVFTSEENPHLLIGHSIVPSPIRGWALSHGGGGGGRFEVDFEAGFSYAKSAFL